MPTPEEAVGKPISEFGRLQEGMPELDLSDLADLADLPEPEDVGDVEAAEEGVEG